MAYKNLRQLKRALGKHYNDLDYLVDHTPTLVNEHPLIESGLKDRIQQLQLERRFNNWLNQLTAEQKSDITFLQKQRDEYASKDIELSARIMARITRLQTLRTSKVKQAPKEDTNTDSNIQIGSTKQALGTQNNNKARSIITRYPFLLIVLLPLCLFSLYQLVWASNRYESQTKVIIRQPDASATLDASMAILSGLGVSKSGGSDNELLKQYIYSTDMLNYLEKTVQLKAHYTDTTIDLFSRLDKTSNESFLEYYKEHVRIEIDGASTVLAIYTQGFDPDFAKRLATIIAKRSEWYINSIGHQLAEAQLSFIQQEQKHIEASLQTAQNRLLTFQQKYNLLDPNADGTAIQQIAYGLEGKITEKETELKSLRQVMSNRSSQILAVNAELFGLKKQLENERERLSRESGDNRPVNEIMAEFTDLKVRLELALQAYTSSQVSLEKSRIEAYRQLKYLVVVEQPTTPDESKYPDVFYNITLFAVLASMLFGVGKIIYLTIKEIG
jgi:capsular polysaccharide transport system permease protein